MGTSRRRLLAAAGAACATLAGCSDGTGTPTSSVDATRSGSTPSASPAVPPVAYLPKPGNGWTLDRTEEYARKELGVSDGVRGYYRGPDGRSYQVVVLVSGQYATGTARSLRCAGWQVAVVLDGVAVGASTGTEQRTFTPERPPTMAASPVPGSDPRVRELVTRSPRISASDIPAGDTCD